MTRSEAHPDLIGNGANSFCPFCARPIEAATRSRDHVFGEAFGGGLKVSCCRDCNSKIGHEVEGLLHRPDSMLALARASAGLPGKPLRGHYKGDGRAVDVHWGGGGAVPRDPRVDVDKKKDGTADIHVEGTEEQVRKLWPGLQKRFGDAIPPIEDALAKGTRTNDPSPWVEINLVNQLPNMHRFAAKVALGGGAAIWGDDFVESALADSLREVLTSPDDGYDPEGLKCGLGYLSAIPEAARGAFPVELPDISVPRPGPNVQATSQVVFGPIPGGSQPLTAIFVHILNFAVPPYGLIVPGAPPHAPTLPVVLREGLQQRAETWNLHQILFDALRAYAVADAAARGDE